MENNLNLESKIESLLFYKGEPMSLNNIASSLKEKEGDVRTAIENLDASKKDSGVVLVRTGEEYTLGTNSIMGPILEEIRKDELSKDLSKAMLETLSIILYKNAEEVEGKAGVTRSEIDYIRGVNSSFILRNLLIRGLIQKNTDKKDTRRYIYEPTLLLLQFMGVSDLKNLPNYTETVAKINNVLKDKEAQENTNE